VRSFSAVIVSWNSGDDLLECIGSLALARDRIGSSREALELIVVDNASDSFPEREIRALWDDARLAVLDRNIGFGPAANHGASHARGEILLFLNPDTRAEGDPFGPLSQAFEEDPSLVAAAPRLLEDGQPGGTGESQEEFQLRRLPCLGSAFRELSLLDRAFPQSRARRSDRYLDRDRETPFEVEQPAAAALAVRRAVFEKVGGFDPRFVPAWWEDVDLCRRLGREGHILYVPRARFRHRGGASLSRLGYRNFLPIYYRNALRYWRKHSGGSAAGLVRAMIVVGMLLRLALLPFRRRVDRPRFESARAYAATIAVAIFGR
jgi:N-acetylglucosaminyl-diphospho-decaprenol L-rhamnosyltransferase